MRSIAHWEGLDNRFFKYCEFLHEYLRKRQFPVDRQPKNVIKWTGTCECGGMADAPDLGSGVLRRKGSSPFTRTNRTTMPFERGCLFLFERLKRQNPHTILTAKYA